MLDEVWVHGGDDESIARSIRNGFPEKGMLLGRPRFRKKIFARW